MSTPMLPGSTRLSYTPPHTLRFVQVLLDVDSKFVSAAFPHVLPAEVALDA